MKIKKHLVDCDSLLPDEISDIIAAHVISGSDHTSGFFNCVKISVIKSTSNGDWRRKQSNHKMGSVNENWSVSWAVWSVAFISFIDQIEIMIAHAGQIE